MDELDETFVIRLVMRLRYIDGHKKYYASKLSLTHTQSVVEDEFRRIVRLDG